MKNVLYPLVLLLIANASSSQTGQRLTGYRQDYYHNATQAISLQDSFEYVYSGNRGSTALNNKVYDRQTMVIATGPDSRYLQQFDPQNRVVDMIQQGWYMNQWINQSHNIFTYNTAGKMTRAISESWDSTVWVSYSKVDLTYDANNDTVLYLESVVDTNNAYYVDVRIAYQHSSPHQLTHRVEEDVTSTIGVFDTAEVYFNAWDSNGNIVQTVRFDVNGNNILDSNYMVRYTYNNAHQVTSTRNWSDNNGDMVLNGGYDYTYTGAGKLSLMVFDGVDTAGHILAYQQALYHYNNAQLPDSLSTLVFDAVHSTWITTEQHVYSYYPNHDLQSHLFLQRLSGTLHNSFLTNYQYNSLHNCSYDEMYVYNNDTAKLNQQEYYWYEDYISGIADVPLPEWNVYPNPAHGHINIQLPEGEYQALSVIDLSGHVVMDEKIAKESVRIEMPLSHLAPGLYLIQLSGENASVSKKIIIQ